MQVFVLAYLGGLALLPRQFNPRLVNRRDTKEEFPFANERLLPDTP